MSIEDEVYFEAHEFELLEIYHDYLVENGITGDEFSFADFINEY